MTAERVIAIGVPLDDERRLLLNDIRSAERRAAKALAGDRSDVVRYEALCSQLEQWMFEHRQDPGAESVTVAPRVGTPWLYSSDEPGDLSWMPNDWGARMDSVLDAGGVVALVTLPTELGNGPSRKEPPRIAPPPPAQAWKSETGAFGTRAVEERFEAQIQEALSGSGGSVSPSGLQNTVVTKVLRKYVGASGKRIDVPVLYRDGSRARNPFPFRSLKLIDQAPKAALQLRLALLSIRHTEMDAVVDGAFLRNAEISQARQAAETDDLVFDISREQLLALTEDGSRRVHLRMYQTGLETAIVGFYRAVVVHLLEHPKSLAVTPMFFSKAQSPKARGKARNGAQGNRPAPRPVDDSGFIEAETWATR